jgi:ubiquinone/menaquinone biosynthesis C-methylase UbiE
MLEEQDVTLEPLPATGWILDVGGGGEGVMGRLMGCQVVAIDLLADELVEAPDGPLKVVMDARDLRFLDASFEIATAFFSFIYLRTEDDLTQALSEINRVLRPGGQLWIWGMEMPARSISPDKDLIAIPLHIHLPDDDISTAYGCQWYDPPRTRAVIEALAHQVGFEICARAIDHYVYTLVLQKPAVH